jgi:two-component system, OmpR family, sensor histidine kinase TctE
MLKLLKLLSQNSLKNQLFSWLILLLLPVIIICAIPSYYLANRYSNIAYDRSLYRSALALADQVSLEQMGIEIVLPQIAKDLIEFDEDDKVYFRVLGPDGDLVSTHTSLPPPTTFPKADQALYYNATLNGQPLRVVIYSLPIEADLLNQQQTKNVYVMIGETLRKRTVMADEILISMLLPQLIILFLVATILFFGINRGLKPLKKLQKELGIRDMNDLRPLDNKKVPDEILPLLHAFNDLLTKLRNSFTKQQRFIADASHQLKTPLAGLKTQAELALRENDSNKVHHALSQINQASVNLSHLVNQLLMLAKAEPEASQFIEMTTIDLNELAQVVCREWVNMALQKHIDLGFSCETEMTTVSGNETLLRELMHNLIDNAVHYTPNNGKITVGLKSEKTSLIFYVQDNGIGISDEDQTRIFERFYRVLGTQQEGCGLGLTIVNEIADRHQATVSVISEGEGKGTLFMVAFKTT